MDCLVLVSRSGLVKHDGQGLNERLDMLLKSNVKVVIKKCDTGVEDEISKLLECIRLEYGPLKYVAHASGVLRDAMMMNQNNDTFKQVFAPKASGAWFLHKHTMQDDLSYFIVFSSISSLFGSLGQVNYAAANSFMDSMVRFRSGIGLKSISIQWPAISGVGMAAAMHEKVKINADATISTHAVMGFLRKILLGNFIKNSVQAFLP